MRANLVLAAATLLFGVAAFAGDYYLGTTVARSTADGGVGGGTFWFDGGCGMQASIRCEAPDAGISGVRYRFCDSQNQPLCMATANDLVLSPNVTYDLRVPIMRTSQSTCAVAFITDANEAICRVYEVKPPTLPSNIQ